MFSTQCPRVVLHLIPDCHELSPQAEQFFTEHGGKDLSDDKKRDLLQEFNELFGELLLLPLQKGTMLNNKGAILPRTVTLGGRLCTCQEVRTEDSNTISQVTKDIRVQLDARVHAAGAGLDNGINRHRASGQSQRSTQADETSRMVLETQGGDGLLTST